MKNRTNIGTFAQSHGYFGTPTYAAWASMLYRCRKPSANNYQWYGARGITVCERWLKFENFLSDMGERPDGLTLDRIDTNGNYEPSNCKWSTRSEQQRNKRPFKWRPESERKKAKAS